MKLQLEKMFREVHKNYVVTFRQSLLQRHRIRSFLICQSFQMVSIVHQGESVESFDNSHSPCNYAFCTQAMSSSLGIFINLSKGPIYSNSHGADVVIKARLSRTGWCRGEPRINGTFDILSCSV